MPGVGPGTSRIDLPKAHSREGQPSNAAVSSSILGWYMPTIRYGYVLIPRHSTRTANLQVAGTVLHDSVTSQSPASP